MPYDVVIVGGGPAGLAAALAFGRARKRVLLCDAGPRRNAAAKHVQNFVTRDGTPPAEFRQIARDQLAQYPSVELSSSPVESIAGARGSFRVGLPASNLEARRILLCTGMIDEMLPIEGFRELWGGAIFQCPYCHGWEVRERRWAYLARGVEGLHFVFQLRGWTRDVVLFTGGGFDMPSESQAELRQAKIRLETQAIARLTSKDGTLENVVLADGSTVACDALFAHPPQQQVQLVRDLNLALESDGLVRVDPMTRETSIPGVYAAGDLTTRMQSATMAAALGVQAAAMINHELTRELAIEGLL